MLRAPGGTVASAAFDAGGSQIVTASSDGVARLWRTRDARLLKSLPRGRVPLSDARLSPDGSFVATAGADGVLRVWSTAGKRVAVIRASLRPLSVVTWAAAGQLLVTTGADAVVRVWANVAPRRPLAARNCSQAQFLLPAGPQDVGARASDGHSYVASISCPARAATLCARPSQGP